MRGAMIGAALALSLFTLPAVAQEGAPQDVIQRQVDAFRAGDAEAAFGYASPGIRALFGTPGNFGRMVREGYPMVWRPAELRFLDAEERGGRRIQKVLMVDGAGVPHVLEYDMIEGEGGWLIDGVRILAAPEVGA